MSTEIQLVGTLANVLKEVISFLYCLIQNLEMKLHS